MAEQRTRFWIDPSLSDEQIADGIRLLMEARTGGEIAYITTGDDGEVTISASRPASDTAKSNRPRHNEEP